MKIPKSELLMVILAFIVLTGATVFLARAVSEQWRKTPAVPAGVDIEKKEPPAPATEAPAAPAPVPEKPATAPDSAPAAVNEKPAADSKPPSEPNTE